MLSETQSCKAVAVIDQINEIQANLNQNEGFSSAVKRSSSIPNWNKTLI